jgi:hypothetical protein
MSTDVNTTFYQFDGCYSQPNATNFDVSLNSRFNKTLVESVAACQAHALRQNAGFFLMNDISFASGTQRGISNEFLSNCYVPKTLSSSLGSIVSANTMLDLFNSLFGSSPRINVTDTCDNILFRRFPANAPQSQKCFKYTLDEQVYAPKTQYAYYKKPVLHENNLRTMISLQSRPTSYYSNPTKLNELQSYKQLLYIDGANTESSGPVYITFKNFICSPTRANEQLFDTQLANLESKYTNIVSHLDDISTDLSNINFLKRNDNSNMIALNTRINDKKQELSTLLGSGGANNGRLSDNVFLTQFKIIENSILLIIIIIACFIYYKTRNLKVITLSSIFSTNANTNAIANNDSKIASAIKTISGVKTNSK